MDHAQLLSQGPFPASFFLDVGHSVRYAFEAGDITGGVPVDYEANALVAGVFTFGLELMTVVVEGDAYVSLPSGFADDETDPVQFVFKLKKPII